jgi:homoserine O-acetyltransferase
MTPMAKTEPWAVAMNHAGRLCLEGEQPNWQSWVTVMQVLAMRTPARFARDVPEPAGVPEWIAQRTAWWATQQCDPLDWTYQSWAYDAHDLGMTPGFDGATDRALRSIRARTLICTPQLDLYNPADAARRAASAIPDCCFLALDADSGHLMASDADPQAALRLNQEIGRFMAEKNGA